MRGLAAGLLLVLVLIAQLPQHVAALSFTSAVLNSSLLINCSAREIGVVLSGNGTAAVPVGWNLTVAVVGDTNLYCNTPVSRVGLQLLGCCNAGFVKFYKGSVTIQFPDNSTTKATAVAAASTTTQLSPQTLFWRQRFSITSAYIGSWMLLQNGTIWIKQGSTRWACVDLQLDSDDAISCSTASIASAQYSTPLQIELKFAKTNSTLLLSGTVSVKALQIVGLPFDVLMPNASQQVYVSLPSGSASTWTKETALVSYNMTVGGIVCNKVSILADSLVYCLFSTAISNTTLPSIVVSLTVFVSSKTITVRIQSQTQQSDIVSYKDVISVREQTRSNIATLQPTALRETPDLVVRAQYNSGYAITVAGDYFGVSSALASIFVDGTLCHRISGYTSSITCQVDGRIGAPPSVSNVTLVNNIDASVVQSWKIESSLQTTSSFGNLTDSSYIAFQVSHTLNVASNVSVYINNVLCGATSFVANTILCLPTSRMLVQVAQRLSVSTNIFDSEHGLQTVDAGGMVNVPIPACSLLPDFQTIYLIHGLANFSVRMNCSHYWRTDNLVLVGGGNCANQTIGNLSSTAVRITCLMYPIQDPHTPDILLNISVLWTVLGYQQTFDDAIRFVAKPRSIDFVAPAAIRVPVASVWLQGAGIAETLTAAEGWGAVIDAAEFAACRIVSDSVVTCTTPNIQSLQPGYPNFSPQLFMVINGSKVVGGSTGMLAYPERLAATWDTVIGPQVILPSSRNTINVYAVRPYPMITLSGIGRITCYFQTDPIITRLNYNLTWGVGLGLADAVPAPTGNSSIVVSLNSTVRSSHEVTFRIGAYAPSMHSLVFDAMCQDDQANNQTFPSAISLRTGLLVASLVSGLPTSNQVIKAVPNSAFNNITFLCGWLTSTVITSETLEQGCSCSVRLSSIRHDLLDSDRSAVATYAEQSSTRINASHTRSIINIASLQGVILGVTYWLEPSCTWVATGEQVKLMPIQLDVLLPEIGLGVLQREFIARQQIYETLYVTTPGASPSIVMDSEAVCSILEIQREGTAGLSALTTAQTMPLTMPVQEVAFPLELKGQTGETVIVQYVCTCWGQDVLSPRISYSASFLRVMNTTALPQYYIPSSGVYTWALSPDIHIGVLGDQDEFALNSTCSVTTSQEISLIGGQVHPIYHASGSIAIPNIYVASTFSPSSASLVISCDRFGVKTADLTVALTPLQFIVQGAEVLDGSVVVGQQAAPSFTVSLIPVQCQRLSDLEMSTCIADTIQTLGFTTTQLAAAAVCKISRNESTASNASLFIQGAEEALDHSLKATFQRLTMIGERGKYFSLVVTCFIGTVAIPSVQSVELQVDYCPAGTQSEGVFCNVCPEGMFSLGGRGAVCQACPSAGATCTSGMLQLLPNYFRPPSEVTTPPSPAMELHPCFNTEACVMNTSNAYYTCKVGYIGPLCGICDAENSYSRFGKVCSTCWTFLQSASLFAVVGVAFLGGITFTALKASRSERSENSIVLRITMGYVQAISALKVFKVGGTSAFKEIMGWTDSLSESPLSSGAFQCLLHSTYLTSFLTMIAIPLVAAAGVVFMFVLVTTLRSCNCRERVFETKKWKAALHDWWRQRRFAATLVFVLFIGYMPMVSASLRAFDCYERPVAGVTYLRQDLRVQCYVGPHIVAIGVALGVLLVLGLGYPLILCNILRKASLTDLQSDTFKAAWGFMYDGYRAGDGTAKTTKLVWWESVILIRKTGIVFLSILISDGFFQLLAAIIWLLIFICLQIRFWPYQKSLFNKLELLALFSTFITAAISLNLVKPDANVAQDVSDKTNLALTLALLLFNFVTLAMLVAAYIGVSLLRVKKSMNARRPGMGAKAQSARSMAAAAALAPRKPRKPIKLPPAGPALPPSSVHKQPHSHFANMLETFVVSPAAFGIVNPLKAAGEGAGPVVTTTRLFPYRSTHRSLEAVIKQNPGHIPGIVPYSSYQADLGTAASAHAEDDYVSSVNPLPNHKGRAAIPKVVRTSMLPTRTTGDSAFAKQVPVDDGDAPSRDRVHVNRWLPKRQSTMNLVLKGTTQCLPATQAISTAPEPRVETFTTFTLTPEDSNNAKPGNKRKSLGLGGNTVVTSPLANVASTPGAAVGPSVSAAASVVVHANPLTRKR